jgi:sugar-specific transcriptional regulator TrmB
MNQEIKEELTNHLDEVYSKIMNKEKTKLINPEDSIWKILSLIDELQNEIEDIN